MKKTLLLTLCAAVAPVFAAAPEGLDMFTALTPGTVSESGNLVISAGTGSMADIDLVAGKDASAFYTANSNQQAGISLTFTLNLTAIKSATISERTALVTFDFSNDTGLFLTPDKKVGSYWQNVPTEGNGRDWEDLFSGDSVATPVAGDTFLDANGNTCLTLTVTQGISSSFGGTGMQVYTPSANIVNDGGLASSGNAVLNGISFNTDYITAVAVAPSTLSENDAKAAAAAVPEPTTATLSLLALAGLAARRRRK